MEIVTLREFARRVGVSLTAIQKGVKTGRVAAITDPDTGKITGIDFESQGPAWSANSKHPQKRPHTISGGRPRADGTPTAAPKHKPSPEAPEEPPPSKPGMSLTEIQRARELVKLQLDNVKLKQAQGELVSAAEVRKQGNALAAVIITGLYSIPERCSDELAGMSSPNDIHALLVKEIDGVIGELRKAYA